MDGLLMSSLVGATVAIAGTGLGGMIALSVARPSRRFLSGSLSFSAGLMIAVVCFDILPEAFLIAGMGIGLLGVVAGVFLVAVCDELIQSYPAKNGGKISQEYKRAGIFMGMVIALHNFPEGLAIGSGFSAFESYGLGLSLVIGIHDISEGVAMAIPMSLGGMGRLKVLIIAFFAGIPTGVGAISGYLLGDISHLFVSVSLGFAGGAMLYLILGELMPKSRDVYKGRISGFLAVLGAIAGIVMSGLI